MSKEFLRTGDKEQVRFRFISYPEYIRPGQKLLLREGRTKAMGTVLSIPLPSEQLSAKPTKPKKLKYRKHSQVIYHNNI